MQVKQIETPTSGHRFLNPISWILYPETTGPQEANDPRQPFGGTLDYQDWQY